MSDTVKFSIPMKNDEEGFFGRECPNEECLGYFKIELGTGLQGKDLPCHCPYCGHVGPHDTFWTQDQLEYTRSAARREVQKYVGDMLKKTLPPSQPRRGDFISITFQYKQGRPLPLYRYEEKQLETALICAECNLRYAVYGVFGYCPDCGSHNSLQILDTNLDLAAKELELANTLEGALAEQLVADALENGISAFDAFGRELFRVNSDLASAPDETARISCQNLGSLKSQVSKLFGIDLTSPFTIDEWRLLVQGFQKRHLIAHRMGVVDQAYINTSGDLQAVVGRKVDLNSEEVTVALLLVRRLGRHAQDVLRTKRAEACCV
jgi:hypothetical protein